MVKKYIGKHKYSGDGIDLKYWSSSKLLPLAYEKYGKDNFSYEILECCETLEELNTREFEIIEEFNCVDSNEYYNLHPGGADGSSKGWHKPPVSDETRKKLSDLQMGNKSNTGKHWFNDGKVEVEAFVCPEGFTKGRLKAPGNKGKFWITDGIVNKYISIDEIIPDGWRKGCTQRKKETQKDD